MRFLAPLFSLLALAATTTAAVAVGPEPVLLWPDGAPGAVGDEDADKPQLRIYLPDDKSATGAGVVICPGGGYGILATDHEGHQVAKWFNRIGVAAFVLKYRLGPRYRHPAPLDDVQRALRYVRIHAGKLGVGPERLGVMGFSAGGHLASTAATHFDRGEKDAKDEIDRQSCRPDFVILGYPVISFTEPFGHSGSKRNLLGERAQDAKLAKLLSNEKQVTKETPPAFLFHTGEDAGVPVENSLAFYAALRRARVPAELHVYQFGPHGVGLGDGDPVLFTWKERLSDWMKTSGYLSTAKRSAISGEITIAGKPLRWGTVTFYPKNKNDPVAWGRVNRGKFSIKAERGPPVGKNRVVIRNLGDVRAEPTIDDVFAMPGVQFTVVDGPNECKFEAGD